jgi:hypothetical protein
MILATSLHAGLNRTSCVPFARLPPRLTPASCEPSASCPQREASTARGSAAPGVAPSVVSLFLINRKLKFIDLARNMPNLLSGLTDRCRKGYTSAYMKLYQWYGGILRPGSTSLGRHAWAGASLPSRRPAVKNADTDGICAASQERSAAKNKGLGVQQGNVKFSDSLLICWGIVAHNMVKNNNLVGCIASVKCSDNLPRGVRQSPVCRTGRRAPHTPWCCR